MPVLLRRQNWSMCLVRFPSASGESNSFFYSDMQFSLLCFPFEMVEWAVETGKTHAKPDVLTFRHFEVFGDLHGEHETVEYLDGLWAEIAISFIPPLNGSPSQDGGRHGGNWGERTCLDYSEFGLWGTDPNGRSMGVDFDGEDAEEPLTSTGSGIRTIPRDTRNQWARDAKAGKRFCSQTPDFVQLVKKLPSESRNTRSIDWYLPINLDELLTTLTADIHSDMQVNLIFFICILSLSIRLALTDLNPLAWQI
jgi:hypothetical protein